MSEISGHTRLMAVIGDPISHSLSPLIQNTLAQRFEIDAAYMAFRVTPGGLADFVSAARALNMMGFNVTMPLKLQIPAYVDALDDTAKGGAVNTVYTREGHLIGGCTDGDGFIKSLTFDAPAISLPKSALILGAGGAARMVALSLAQAAVSVTVASRSAIHFDTEGISVRFCPWDTLEEQLPACDLLVNATPLGMSGAEDFPHLDFLQCLPRTALVYDLVYNPRETPLLRRAEALGLRTLGGLSHLIGQGVLSFEMFTGCRPAYEDIIAIRQRLGL